MICMSLLLQGRTYVRVSWLRLLVVWRADISYSTYRDDGATYKENFSSNNGLMSSRTGWVLQQLWPKASGTSANCQHHTHAHRAHHMKQSQQYHSALSAVTHFVPVSTAWSPQTILTDEMWEELENSHLTNRFSDISPCDRELWPMTYEPLNMTQIYREDEPAHQISSRDTQTHAHIGPFRHRTGW